MTDLYIVRHAESESNTNHRLGLDFDAKLTEVGVEDATLTERKLSDVNFSKIFSSDVKRAMDTATILASSKSVIVEASKLLRERSYGSLDGKTEDEIASILGMKFTEYQNLPRSEKYKFRLVSDMETEEEASERFLSFLRKIAADHQGESILIVTHNTLIRDLLVKLNYAPLDEISRQPIANAGYLHIVWDGKKFLLKEIYKENNTSSKSLET